MLMAMQWLKQVIAAALVVIWLPATSLCLIEAAGFLESHRCCPSGTPSAPASEPTNDSPCCLLASGSYKSNDDDGGLVIDSAFLLLSISDFVEPPELGNNLPLNSAVLSPPELLCGWQFSLRAALPPRAPSFVS